MGEPIQFFNRYTGEVETEKVYGERSLRWTYETVAGKTALHLFVKRAVFSRWYGWRMDRPASRKRIEPFIEKFGLDADEFLDSVDSFPTFNAFFYRELKTDSRPIDPDPNRVVFPADGRHLAVERLDRMDRLFVKGQCLELETLLGSAELAGRFEGGSLILSRRCPVDYHRYHFSCDGRAGEPSLLNGPLYSVNPLALRQKIEILAENKRTRTVIETERLGTVVQMEIGATCVGSMVSRFSPGQPLAKGEEKGYFRFGGSSTITLFERGRVRLDTDLLDQSRLCRELYARMGDGMGTLVEG
ncbi:MAG: phosphatidylserine decarboxylase [Verrucomicrobiota bacterium]